ncbi:622_t:CDS:2 [Ambispora gerdemannii]|uniref:622_t:CDS:1 n=1 Tax=Ambispora gerdemannii TaxID=144530 RepID=A0A9N9DNI9_9GLOM|nr:622_t:CDS:2 [Ambispora gerdemannii]
MTTTRPSLPTETRKMTAEHRLNRKITDDVQQHTAANYYLTLFLRRIKTLLLAEIAGLTSANYDPEVGSLYQAHGLKENHKTYRFFLNLYEYEKRTAWLNGKSKFDQLTGHHLNNQQTIFRHYDYENQSTTYFYKTNERLVGQCAKPVLIKKNYRLGTRSLNPLSLLSLATKHHKKELYLFKKPKQQLKQDFQEFLITRLLLLCKSAEFVHLPLEQDKVPKENQQCSSTIYTHFATKPVLHFQFLPENAAVVRAFIAKLDTYALEFDMEESSNFYSYPIVHDTKHETIKQISGLCGCEPRARNQYLDN